MSLLLLKSNEELVKMTQSIFDTQFNMDHNLGNDLDDRRKRLMLQDIYYNIDNLEAAISHDSDLIVVDYINWLMGLLAYRLKHLGLERVKVFMIDHYLLLKEAVEEVMDEDYITKAEKHISNAIETIKKFELHDISYLDGIRLESEAKNYLEALLVRDRQKASDIILSSLENGATLEEVYIELFRPVMHEVGNLWYKNIIAVDKEHYATAVTQGVMSQLYPRIFATPKNGKTMVALCVGNELHEMGIRMLSDLFEIQGWDTIYLGASVPWESLIGSLEEYNPDLITLSVTMPNYLNNCRDTIEAIRKDKRFDHMKIAVGGKALDMGSNLREKWNIDVKATSYEELLEWTRINL